MKIPGKLILVIVVEVVEIGRAILIEWIRRKKP